MPDFTRYVPPGVYVEPGPLPTLRPPGIDPSVVCLIGNGVGYNTYTEAVNFSTATSALLTKRGINPATILVRGYITDPGASGVPMPKTFATTTDYTTTVDTTPGLDEATVYLNRVALGTIENEYPVVSVTYQYTDTNYHTVQWLDDFDTFQDMYGPAFDPQDGSLASPLTLAAQLAMQNGANELYSIALNPAAGNITQQFLAAYDQLQAVPEANLIVPLFDGATTDPPISGMCNQLAGWLLNEANDANLRMAIVGFDSNWDPTTTELSHMATTLSSKRTVFAWPHRLQIYNGIGNHAVTIDGFYLAAAYAGILQAQRPQDPLTRKHPRGFLSMESGIEQTLTKSVKNRLSASGIAVTETDRRGRMVVRHGLTTDWDGGILTREISLVRAADALYKVVQQTLEEAGLIGTPISPGTSLNVKAITSGALEVATISGIIYDYSNLKVRQQVPPSGDPTVIEVKFAYKPTWPLNYILVSFTVDLTSGENSLSSDFGTTSPTQLSDSSTNLAVAQAAASQGL